MFAHARTLQSGEYGADPVKIVGPKNVSTVLWLKVAILNSIFIRASTCLFIAIHLKDCSVFPVFNY